MLLVPRRDLRRPLQTFEGAIDKPYADIRLESRPGLRAAAVANTVSHAGNARAGDSNSVADDLTLKAISRLTETETSSAISDQQDAHRRDTLLRPPLTPRRDAHHRAPNEHPH